MNPEDFGHSSAGKVIRHPKGYWAFIPAPLPPEISWFLPLVSLLAEAERNLSRLAGLAGTLPSPQLLVLPFIRKEAVLSSRIEGTKASLADLYTFEAVQLSFFEQSTDVREVHNYVRALDYGLGRLSTLPVSLRLIREIHSILMEGVRGEYLTPGEFRRTQNWIGPPGSTLEKATFVPPPVEDMHLALDQLEKYLYSKSQLPPLVQIGLIHYQFEAIHPFLDGNGRMGRLLMILLLCEWDLLPEPILYLSAYFEANRSEYYERLLAISQRGDWEGWLTFFLAGITSQSKDSIIRIDRLQSLRMAYQNSLRTERASERLFLALDVIFEHPILTVRQMEASLGVPYLTAQRYVEKMVKKGILGEITGRERNRIYRADEILRTIERPLENGAMYG